MVNYPSPDESFTRIVEYKHFWNQSSPDTLISREYSTDNGDPYYPVPNKKNRDLYELYKQKTHQTKNIFFLGRLASYKYLNMDEAILCGLETFEIYKKTLQ